MKNTIPEPLYHYCSNEAFCSILKSKSLWLSSLSLSNDKIEGQWFYKIFTKALKKAGHDEQVGQKLKTRSEQARVDMFGLCLSEDKDLLSQWRGYAAGGAGVSIGFNRSFLQSIKKPPKVPALIWAKWNIALVSKKKSYYRLLKT